MRSDEPFSKAGYLVLCFVELGVTTEIVSVDLSIKAVVAKNIEQHGFRCINLRSYNGHFGFK